MSDLETDRKAIPYPTTPTADQYRKAGVATVIQSRSREEAVQLLRMLGIVEYFEGGDQSHMGAGTVQNFNKPGKYIQ